jgi:glycosyltransferase involved in cell wall biosynthesis
VVFTAAPDVSVVIPTRNRWPLLRTALASALRQEDTRLEVIVVDDGSTDDTSRELARMDGSEVRVVRHELPLGAARARNAGIAAARSEWVAFLDDDDWWAPRKLRNQLDAAAGGAAFAYSAAVHVDASGSVVYVAESPAPGELASRLRGGNVMPAGASNVLVRTDAVRRLGGFDPLLPHFNDWDLWIRLARAERGARCADVHVAYLQHSANMRAADSRSLLRELAYVDSKHHATGPKPDREPDRRRLMRWIADGQRAAGRRWRAAGLDMRAALRYRSGRDAARALASVVGSHARARPSHPAAGLQRPEWLDWIRPPSDMPPRLDSTGGP